MKRILNIFTDYWLGLATLAFVIACVFVLWRVL